MSERWKKLGWLAVLALLPVLVLYVGRPGDDALFHVSSWMEMAAGWRAGVWAPAWAARANFGLGEPRFMFYPPLTIVLGAALRMVMPAVAVPGVMVWVEVFIAGCSMLMLAGEVLPEEDRSRAAMLYVTSFYLLIVAVLRFAVGELMAVALLPAVVMFYLRVLRWCRGRMSAGLGRELERGVKDVAGLAVALAGMWVSDAPASLAAFYVLAAVALVESVRWKKAMPLVMLVVAEAGAVGLVGPYLVPAMLERGRIGAANLLNHPAVNFMLGHRPGKGMTPAMTYPLWGWLMFGTAAAVWLSVRARRKARVAGSRGFGMGADGVRLEEVERGQTGVLALMAGAALLFQLPLSLPLWRTLPQLAFVQFPYRFDGVLGCVLPLVCLLLVRRKRARGWMYAGWGLFVVVALGTKVLQERSRRGGLTFTEIVREVRLGYGGSPEFSTKGLPLAGPGGAERVGSLGSCVATVDVWTPEKRVFDSGGSETCVYRVGLRYFPDWRMWVDGQEAQGTTAAGDGLTLVRVPAGNHVVELKYVRPGWMEALGVGVSGMALLAVAGVWFKGRRRGVLGARRVDLEAMA